MLVLASARSNVRGAFAVVVCTSVIAAMPLDVRAGEGVVELNQTCAIQTGCFSEDAPGFPITIDSGAPRNFHLASDLVVGNQNITAISVSIDDVTIDLAGFTIRGPSVCSGPLGGCTPSTGSGSGVRRLFPSVRSTTVRNGNVVGMGEIGLLLGDEAVVVGVRTRFNRGAGIWVGDGSAVMESFAYFNGATGIQQTGLRGGRIERNTVYSNGGDGIVSGGSSIVTGNNVYENGFTGIAAGIGAIVSQNRSTANGANGISANDGSSLEGNSAIENDHVGIVSGSSSRVSNNVVLGNGENGVDVGSGSMVEGNVLRGNVRIGLILGSQTTYRGNTIGAHPQGTVTGSGVDMGGNSCAGATSCP